MTMQFLLLNKERKFVKQMQKTNNKLKDIRGIGASPNESFSSEMYDQPGFNMLADFDHE